MGQASAYLRRTTLGYSHWCPGCEGMHAIAVFEAQPNGAKWSFDGNLDAPSFTPSVNITWPADPDPEFQTPAGACHYYLTEGMLIFQGDSTHALSGQTVPLPQLPPHARD